MAELIALASFCHFERWSLSWQYDYQVADEKKAALASLTKQLMEQLTGQRNAREAAALTLR